MQYLIKTLTFIIPSLGMIAGLSAASTIILFLVSLLSHLKNKLTFPMKNIKLELIFIFWCVLSCFWSPNPIASLLMCLQVIPVIFLGLIVKKNINKLTFQEIRIESPLIWTLFVAISLFFIEYFSSGLISLTFRKIFQTSSTKSFQLYDLDRGCALFSLVAWIVIGIFVSRKRYFLSYILYIFTLYMLSMSDSLATFLAFAVSGLIIIISKLVTLKFIQFVSFCLILGSLLMPIIAYKIEPRFIADNYSQYIPDSAKHRLFIWHFVSNKIIEKPIFGSGFGSSKIISSNNDQMIEYKGYHWSPLPLHPHNNIMQIFLETGLIGLLLFLALAYKFLKQIEFAILDKKEFNFGLIAFACFINYYIIGMISFNIWQLWWVCTGIWSSIIIQCLRSKPL